MNKDEIIPFIGGISIILIIIFSLILVWTLKLIFVQVIVTLIIIAIYLKAIENM